MKFLISVKPNHNAPAPPPDQMPMLLRGFIDEIRTQLNSHELDCCYATGQNEGFAIAEASSVEQAWALVARNPMAFLWETEVIALGDPITITEQQLQAISRRQPVAV